MATTCEYARTGRTATFGKKNKTKYVVPYDITADDPTWGAKRVLANVQIAGPNPLPVLYSVYDVGDTFADIGAFVSNISLTQDSTQLTHWRATVTFEPLEPNQQPGDAAADPLVRPVKYWIEFETATEQIDTAWNITPLMGRPADTKGPVVNAALKEYIEPLFEDDYIPILVVQKNHATIAEIYGLVTAFKRTLNKDTFGGFDAEHVMWRGLESSLVQTENGIEYYTGTTRLALAEKPWRREIVNHGFQYLEDGKLVEAKDDDGQRVSEEVLLTLGGEKLPTGQLGTTIEYRTRRLVNYSGEAGLDIGI